MKTKTTLAVLLLAALAPVAPAASAQVRVVIGGHPGWSHYPWPQAPVIVTVPVQPVVVAPYPATRPNPRGHDRGKREVPAVRNAPGYGPRTPSHPTLAPGGHGGFPGPAGGYVQSRRPERRDNPTVVQAIPGHFFPPTPRATDVRIVIGAPRAQVFAILGRPDTTIMRAGRETLIFGGKTIVIQNGVVAVIR